MEMSGYNIVKYNVPAFTEIMFCVPTLERDFGIQLINGSVQLLIDNTTINLSLHQEYHISGLQCLSPVLYSKDRSVLIFRGDHYIIYARSRENKNKSLLGVSMNGESLIFVLQREAQLQIFVGDENSQIKLQAIRGLPGIFGSPLVRNKKYRLRPNTSVIISSLNDEMFIVGIEGKNRIISVFLEQDQSLNSMKCVHNHIYTLRMKAMNDNCVGPTVLVLGQSNAGKSTLCHLLLNKAVDDGMNPIYVDLEVRGNVNNLPGTISLLEIKGHCHIRKGFPKHTKHILQFGDVNIENNSKISYCNLIKRMGELLQIHQTDNLTNYSGAIIDMCGIVCEDISTILCICNSFKIDLVIFVGDKQFYDVLQNSGLRALEYVHLSCPQNIEPRDEIKDIKCREMILRKYFYGKIRRPIEETVNQIKFSQILIFRIVSCIPKSAINVVGFVDNKCFKVERLSCASYMERQIFGVSQARNIEEYSPFTEIDYFICFTKVDMENKIISFLTPEPGRLPKILILGNMKMI